MYAVTKSASEDGVEATEREVAQAVVWKELSHAADRVMPACALLRNRAHTVNPQPPLVDFI